MRRLTDDSREGYHEAQMQAPGFGYLYRALEPEFQAAREVIRPRRGLSQKRAEIRGRAAHNKTGR
jgi:hypothetical protein